MTPGTVVYELISTDQPPTDPWESLLQDVAQDPHPYGVLRTFGLEGRVTFGFDQRAVAWGGFLLDFACGLADWIRTEPATYVIHPAEQSADVRLSHVDGTLVFEVIGGERGSIDLAAGRRMFRRFLRDLATEIGTRAPRVGMVAGFEWVAEFARFEGTGSVPYRSDPATLD